MYTMVCFEECELLMYQYNICVGMKIYFLFTRILQYHEIVENSIYGVICLPRRNDLVVLVAKSEDKAKGIQDIDAETENLLFCSALMSFEISVALAKIQRWWLSAAEEHKMVWTGLSAWTLKSALVSSSDWYLYDSSSDSAELSSAGCSSDASVGICGTVTSTWFLWA